MNQCSLSLRYLCCFRRLDADHGLHEIQVQDIAPDGPSQVTVINANVFDAVASPEVPLVGQVLLIDVKHSSVSSFQPRSPRAPPRRQSPRGKG